MVAAGRVSINGRVATLGERVDPNRDRIAVDGRAVGGPPEPVYIAVNKPAGVTSTVSDRHAEHTILELVPDDMLRRHGRVYPVGRLDRDSEGLLLLTNDGDWAQGMLHPRYEVEREYAVGLAAPLDARQQRALRTGVDLDEGRARVASLRPQTATETRRLEALVGRSRGALVWYRAVLRQGWKRQLRRMFGAIGAPVDRLVRVRVGSLRLDGLRSGAGRELSRAETERLARRPAARTSPARGLVVSLDGPGSSGKSTVGAGAAVELGYRFLDTGVLYRALTWLGILRGVDHHDAPALAHLASELELTPDDRDQLRRVRVGGQDVTDALHSAEVDQAVSVVSAHPDVRGALLPVQRGLASDGRIIMAGRDIGSIVLPDADPKLYIDVSVEERARRRAEQRGFAAGTAEATEIEAELRERDRLDSSRAVAPLRVPEGAMIIRTDGNTVDEAIAQVVKAIRRRERELGPR
jgi:cytidylate kinase